MFRNMSYGEMLFWLALAALGFAYYKAVVAEADPMAHAIQQIWFAFSGRNAAGNFPNYPK